jgi:hypothetical protein
MDRLTNSEHSNEQRRNYEKRLRQGYPRNIPEERFLKLAHYEDLAEQGRLIELPCKVGDKLYEPTNRNTISVYEVTGLEVGKLDIFIHWKLIDGYISRSTSGVYSERIGNIVFLTKEEAEKKLKEMESD